MRSLIKYSDVRAVLLVKFLYLKKINFKLRKYFNQKELGVLFRSEHCTKSISTNTLLNSLKYIEPNKHKALKLSYYSLNISKINL